MLISIIVPVYRGEELLPDFFRSIEELHLPDSVSLEVVLGIDGLRFDQAIAFPENFVYPLRVFLQEPKGQSAATNRACRAANGHYLWLSAQDMRFFPDSLNELLKHPLLSDKTLVQGNIIHSPELLKDYFTQYIAEKSSFQFAYNSISNVNDLSPTHHYAPHAFVNRMRFMEIGGYDESLPYGFQDTDFGLRWRRSGGKIVLAEGSKALHYHSFEYKSYKEKLFRIGESCVDFFQKWDQEKLICDFVNDIINSQHSISSILKTADNIIELWEREELDYKLMNSSADTLPLDLDVCFKFSLHNSFNQGVRTRCEELKLQDYYHLYHETDPYVPGKPIYDWIDKLANKKEEKETRPSENHSEENKGRLFNIKRNSMLIESA